MLNLSFRSRKIFPILALMH